MNRSAAAQRMLWSGFLLLWLALALGCAGRRELAPQAGAEVPVAPAGLQVLAYFAWLEAAPALAVSAELERLLRAPRGPVEEVQRALLLSASARASEAGEEKARRVLDALVTWPAEDAREADYLEFGRVWRRVLILRENLQGAAASMRAAGEAMRSTDANLRQVQQDLEAAHVSHEDSAQQIRELETQIEALRRQIEALTSIEQQLIEREQSQNP